MNDYLNINWKKVKRYLGEFYRVVDDRPYTRKEIKKLVDTAHNSRDKASFTVGKLWDAKGSDTKPANKTPKTGG